MKTNRTAFQNHGTDFTQSCFKLERRKMNQSMGGSALTNCPNQWPVNCTEKTDIEQCQLWRLYSCYKWWIKLEYVWRLWKWKEMVFPEIINYMLTYIYFMFENWNSKQRKNQVDILNFNMLPWWNPKLPFFKRTNFIWIFLVCLHCRTV